MHSFGKKILKFLLIACLLGLLSFGIFIFAFNKMTSNYNSKFDSVFEKTVTSISTLNNSIESVDSFDYIPATLKLDLEQARDGLIDEKNTLSSSNIPKEYSELTQSLIHGLDNNIRLYKEMLLLPNLKNSSELQTSLEHINDYANACVTYYDETLNSDFSVSMPDGTFSLVENMQKYILLRKTDLDKKMQEDAQKDKYIQEVQSVYSDFLSFYQTRNKSQLMDDVRANNEYQTFVDSLESETESVNKLLDRLVPIVPVHDYTDVTPDLKDLIYNYVLYVQFFKHAVSFEMGTDMITDDIQEQLDSLYELADEKLAVCEKNYSSFEDAFQKLKRSN